MMFKKQLVRIISITSLSIFLFNVGSAMANPNHTHWHHDRMFFRHDHYTTTKEGRALKTIAHRPSAGADIAFSALADALTIATSAALEAATDGAASPALTVISVEENELLNNFFSSIRSNRVELPKMAKFHGEDGVGLHYDGGEWCGVASVESLSILKDDHLDPMVRRDIPSSANTTACRWPDGFYRDVNSNHVWMLFSGAITDPTWYGIGFGSHYCKVPDYTALGTLVSKAFPDLAINIRDYYSDWPTEANQLSQKLFDLVFLNIDSNVTSLEMLGTNRINALDCAADLWNPVLKAVYPQRRGVDRTIFYPEHWDKTAHGALFISSNGKKFSSPVDGHALGIVMGLSDLPIVSTVGGTIITATDKITAAIQGSHPYSYQLQAPMDEMNKSDHSQFLRYDRPNNRKKGFCGFRTPEALKQLRQGVSLSGNFQDWRRSSDGNLVLGDTLRGFCPYPDGFYRHNQVNIVYFLFSDSDADPTIHGIGMGNKYCVVPSYPAWQNLLENVGGGNKNKPENSLHKFDNTDFLESRTKTTCPSNLSLYTN